MHLSFNMRLRRHMIWMQKHGILIFFSFPSFWIFGSDWPIIQNVKQDISTHLWNSRSKFDQNIQSLFFWIRYFI